ncbi:LysR family transcriptional regulator [Streptomyces sp. P1-3]|uniref:LysR family transcriptional regulator n=1 Tax=Streptomyces sp. P1-3 TaxID=3421658 RepID=UPI003D368041
MTADPSAHQLRLLLVLAEELHFGRAAKRLYISQPALSRQIRSLEEHLGVALVERSTRRVELTPAGEVLLPRARAVVDAFGSLREAAEAEAHSRTGRVVLGSYTSALPSLRILMDQLRERHPVPDIEWREVGHVDYGSALLDGRIDAAICYGPAPEGIHTLRLGTEARYVCLPDTHPLADREAVSLAELADLPVIGFSPHVDPEARAFWAADPRPCGTPVRYTDHAPTTLESCVTHVSMGHGIRFVPESYRHVMPRPGVRYLPVTGLSPCIGVLAWSATRPPAPALRSLQRLLRDHARPTDLDTLIANNRWSNAAPL